MYTSSLPILKPVVQSEIFSNMWALVVEIMVITTSTQIRTIWKYVGKPSHTKLDVNLKLTMLAPSIMADI